MEIQEATIDYIGPTIEITNYKYRRIVLKIDEMRNGVMYGNYAIFRAVNKICTVTMDYKEGEKVRVLYNMNGVKKLIEGEHKYYCNNDIYHIEKI